MSEKTDPEVKDGGEDKKLSKDAIAEKMVELDKKKEELEKEKKEAAELLEKQKQLTKDALGLKDKENLKGTVEDKGNEGQGSGEMSVMKALLDQVTKGQELSMKVIEKSLDQITAQNEVLSKMQEEFNGVVERMEKVEKGGEVTKEPKSTLTKQDLLDKQTDDGGDKDKKAKLSKTRILDGLEKLYKEAEPGEKQMYMNAIATFEATGHITDEMLLKSGEKLGVFTKAA